MAGLYKLRGIKKVLYFNFQHCEKTRTVLAFAGRGQIFIGGVSSSSSWRSWTKFLFCLFHHYSRSKQGGLPPYNCLGKKTLMEVELVLFQLFFCAESSICSPHYSIIWVVYWLMSFYFWSFVLLFAGMNLYPLYSSLVVVAGLNILFTVILVVFSWCWLISFWKSAKQFKHVHGFEPAWTHHIFQKNKGRRRCN